MRATAQALARSRTSDTDSLRLIFLEIQPPLVAKMSMAQACGIFRWNLLNNFFPNGTGLWRVSLESHR